MTMVLILALVVALGVALFKLRQQGQGLRWLERAARQRQRFLIEESHARFGADWHGLCEAINANSAELIMLQQSRTNQLAQLEATLGSLQEAVLIVDKSNGILLANAALQSIFPTAKNILGQRLELVLQSPEFLDYVETVRTGRNPGQKPIEFAKDNDSVWVEVTGTLITSLDGQKTEWVLFVLHDITRQRKLESLRKEFVANVSHELRTPLSVIKGYVETLVDDHREIPVEDRDRFLLTIQRHTERLNSLLDDLLVLSRLESSNPGLAFESVQLPRLMTALVDDYRSRPAAASHRLTLSIDSIGVGEVWIDSRKIAQSIENLLDNALKYSPPGSIVAISAQLKDREIEVCVEDNGPGIPTEDLPHIFERFYRVDKGRSREKGGTGLGLSIVKHIVQLHGGRLWAESQPGQGTRVGFTLPPRN